MFDIPSDKYSYELLQDLYRFLFSEDEGEKNTATLIMRILKMEIPYKNARVEDIAKVKLSEEEQGTIIDNGWLESENVEVRCLCNDLMLKSFEGDRRKKALDICKDYLLAYKTVKYGTEYLLRSIQIANYFHVSDGDYINNVCTYIKQVPSAWLKDIAKETKTLLPEDKKQELISFLLIAKEKIDYAKNHASNERDCLKALYILGYYDKDKYLYETALSFERTADYFDNIHKDDPNTYQYGAIMYMDKAYKAIVKVKKQYRQDYLRLQKKLVEQKLIENEAIGLFGVKMPYKVSDELLGYVARTLIGKDSMHVIKWMLDIPFLNDDEIRKKEREAGEEYKFLYESFSKSKYSNSEGNTVGTASGTEVVGEDWYKHYRVNINAAIVYCMDYISFLDEPIFKDSFSNQIKDCQPSFIEDDKVHLWQRVLLAGLDFDWNLAVFMLIPLVERALHNLAEERSGEDLTELEKEIQKEPSLGKNLQMLKGHVDDGALRELTLFLEKGSGENLRNKVAHGLITEQEIQLWAPYLWWIAMKIYFEKL